MLDHIERFQVALGKWFEPVGFDVQWVEHPGNGTELTLGGAPARLWRVAHDATSIAIRLQLAGGSLAYSGDSDDCDGLRQLCDGVDVAILECSTDADHKLPGHLTPREVASIARDCSVGRVVLVHIYPELDGVDLPAQVARFGYTGRVDTATDGFVIGF